MFAEFLSQNLIWFGALVAVAALLAMSFIQSQVKGAKTVSALQMPQLQRGGKSVIIDVNADKDYALSHIPDSLNFPLESINQDNVGLLKNKDKTVVVVCQAGGKSIKAARSLLKLGFADVHILRGGLLAWTKENLPVSSS